MLSFTLLKYGSSNLLSCFCFFSYYPTLLGNKSSPEDFPMGDDYPGDTDDGHSTSDAEDGQGLHPKPKQKEEKLVCLIYMATKLSITWQNAVVIGSMQLA